MGADIYLQSVNDKAKAKWEPLFHEAVKARNAVYPMGTAAPEDDPLQKAVVEAYEGMYGEGYYRDSYNSTSLFSLLGLSWWQFDGYDEDGNMPVPAMQKLLATLDASPVTDALMAEWAAKNARRAKIDDGDNSLATWQQMFARKRERLMRLLTQAIELNEPLRCSV